MNASDENDVAYIIAATLVLGTYTQWFYHAWLGQRANVLVTAIALLLTLAAARTIFGGGVMGKSLAMLSDIKDLAEKAKEREEQREKQGGQP